MRLRSAGVLLYRRTARGLEVLLVHPGGPFFRNKDDGSWGIPKGLIDAEEDALTAARREFEEEVGSPPPPGPALELGEVRQKSGKRVTAWALEGDLDAERIRSNTFRLEWPPHSGRSREFPEVDRAAWLDMKRAREKIKPAQRDFLDRLEKRLSGG